MCNRIIDLLPTRPQSRRLVADLILCGLVLWLELLRWRQRAIRYYALARIWWVCCRIGYSAVGWRGVWGAMVRLCPALGNLSGPRAGVLALLALWPVLWALGRR